MYKIASIALTAALGVAGVAQSQPAEAHPYVAVGIGYPGAVVVEPYAFAPAYYGPYYYGHGRYWHHGYDRYRYEHFRHWDRR
jgi:hypothetical protein